MPNPVALSLFVIIASMFIADAVYFNIGLPTLAMEQIARLSEWLAFWR